MTEKSGVEQSKLLTTLKSTLGDIAIQCDTAGRTVSTIIGGVVYQTLSAGVKFFKSHTGYARSGLNSKTYSVSTTDATATVIASVAVPSGWAIAMNFFVVGMQDDATDAFAATGVGAATNAAGTTAAKGTPLYRIVESNAATDVAFNANDTDDVYEIKVTGVAAENWAWTAYVDWQLVKTSA